MRSKNALPLLKKRLQEQGDRRAKWREIRDEEVSDEKREAWRKRLDEFKPKQYFEIELGYAISQIDPMGEGIKLLGHDLAAVREGAWLGLGEAATVELIERVYQERKKSRHPHFRYAAYRAIDHMLINIAAVGGQAELEELKKLPQEIKDAEGVGTRVEWTVFKLEKMQNNVSFR